MSKDAGGSAFPVPLGNPGMTLRDYFAAKAMQSLFDYLLQMDGAVKLDSAAKDSYRMADAMLVERGKND